MEQWRPIPWCQQRCSVHGVECDSVLPVVLGCPDRVCCLKLAAKLIFLFLCLPLVTQAVPPGRLVLQHVSVIDGTGAPPQPDQTVIVANGRIQSVSPANQIKTEKTDKIVDARGKFLIPGLWDMHVHLAGVLANPAWSKDVLLPLLLAHGITGVRDMGGDLEPLLSWKRDVESGTLLGPHIYAAGPWLSSVGHKSPEQYPVANAEEARAAVRDLKQRGADFIKVLSITSRDVFLAIADESKKQNLTFVGHLPLEVSAAEASNAGMRSIEHLYYSAFAFSVSSKENALRQQMLTAEKNADASLAAKAWEEAIATYNPEKARALWKTLKANNTWVTPTLEGIFVAGHPSPLHFDKALLDFLPQSLVKDWQSGPPENSPLAARTRELAKLAEDDWKLTREMHAAGVSLLAGSDSLDERVVPGMSLHLELAQLVKAGFTPLEALQCATQRAAQFLGREKDWGTVSVGEQADLVLLSRDPSRDISNSSAIDAVIFRGEYLDRAALDHLLENAREAAARVK